MVNRKQALILTYTVLAVLVYELATKNPTDNATQGLLIDTISGLKNGMKTSTAGLSAIQSREGYMNTVYTDTVGYLTGGVGHKLTSADKVRFSVGDPLSDSQISTWFASDILHAENLVNYYVTIPISQNQFDALVSMTFNLGGALWKNKDGSDTGINTALQNGDYAAASNQIMRWVIPSSIIGRRQSEQEQFLT